MVTLRCTAKLLAKLGIERRPPNPPPPTNRLGDWYANILYSRAGHYVVCLSERSGLAVVLEGKELHTLSLRFLRTLRELLGTLGIAPAEIDREMAETGDLAFGATTNRSAVALLNRAVWELRFMLPFCPDHTIYDWMAHFSHRPCGRELQFPDRLVRELLAPRSEPTIVNGG